MVNNAVTDQQLVAAAETMMQKYSYAPYSHFNVGAALLTASGQIYTGCNIENAAFGASICAERTAIFKAISDGHRDFSAIAIVGGKDGRTGDICPPCGVCRQVMSEFCDADFRIILTGRDYRIQSYTLQELLPLRFGLTE